MNVKEIIVSWLQQHGYDGLYSDCECGCGIDNLFLCGNDFSHCYPGVKAEENNPDWIRPRPEKSPSDICRELKCTGGLDGCPGNMDCPAVQHMNKNPVDCIGVVDYLKRQISLSRRCSFCHGENSGDCNHCSSSENDPDKT